jgi:hypothetical protein
VWPNNGAPFAALMSTNNCRYSSSAEFSTVATPRCCGSLYSVALVEGRLAGGSPVWEIRYPSGLVFSGEIAFDGRSLQS